MIVIIIAGGSGTRLWPLSTPEYPKHLIKINGEKRSLLQQAYTRAKRLTDKVYVVSEASHIEHVRQQLEGLPKDNLICEPGRRGTANCLIAALDHISKRHDPDEPIASIHADHYIRDIAGFKHTFKVAQQLVCSEHRIILIGIEPNEPTTGFGYIEKGELLSEEPFAFNVASFKEKPDHKTAMTYVRSGKYLWNGGYFMATLDIFKRSMQNYAPDLYKNYQKLSGATEKDYEKIYLNFESDTIDYALIEKVPDLLVTPALFDWMDLGTYADLARVIGGEEDGNYVHGLVALDGAHNTFVQNYEDKPVAIIGLDNCVVVNTSQGLLVMRKDQSQKVGEVSKRFIKGVKS